MYTFSANTVIESAKVNQNFTDLTTGAGDTAANSLQTFRDEAFFDFVASGGVWSGDSYAVNRNASMTAMIVYINGRRISIGAVSARTFTASKDTYIDVLDNADGTGTLVYTEATNNAASPALASNSIRIGIIITGATTIAAATSVNQGQETMVLPIASSVAYSVCDSLGNLICNRSPYPTVLGLRQLVASVTGITSVADITGLSVPVIVPTGRKIELELFFPQIFSSVTTDRANVCIKEGATIIQGVYMTVGGQGQPTTVTKTITPTAGSHTYKATGQRDVGTGSLSFFSDGTTGQAYLLARLV